MAAIQIYSYNINHKRLYYYYLDSLFYSSLPCALCNLKNDFFTNTTDRLLMYNRTAMALSQCSSGTIICYTLRQLCHTLRRIVSHHLSDIFCAQKSYFIFGRVPVIQALSIFYVKLRI